MEVTDYQSSKGPKPILGMSFPYLRNAIAIVAARVRDGATERLPELEAMTKRRDKLEADFQAAEAAKEGVGA